MNSSLFQRYDEKAQYQYKEDHLAEVRKMGYDFISEAFVQEYLKGFSLSQIAIKLDYTSSGSVRYHLLKIQKLLNKKILRSRGGANYRKTQLSESEKSDIKYLYEEGKMGSRRIAKVIQLSEPSIRRYLLTSKIWKKGWAKR